MKRTGFIQSIKSMFMMVLFFIWIFAMLIVFNMPSHVENVRVSQGDYDDRIVIQWDETESKLLSTKTVAYQILRFQIPQRHNL